MLRTRTVEMVSTNGGTTLIERIPNEILEKILSEALLSSGFSWPNHVCRMYNNLCQVNVRFRDITNRLVSMLPSIYLSNGGELGMVSVRSLIKKFGSSSGVGLKVRRIVASQIGQMLGWINDFVVWDGLYTSTYSGAKITSSILLTSALSYPSRTESPTVF